MAQARIGIIGGSGLYKMEGLTGIQEIKIDTPFGKSSDSITLGTLEGERVAFLPRHGRGHRIMPTNLPVKANIYALKTLGVERIISVSAVGSLREELRPLDLVVPHQLIDRTYHRDSTFFDKDVVAHIAFSDPFCPTMSELLYKTASATGARAHAGGTMVVMEGPAFSTRAESNMYRQWGADIIGMTALPEAKLAREAEICYSTLACVTDYDCWREATEVVTVEMVVANLLKNGSVSQRVLKDLIPKIPRGRNCGCGEALKDAIITTREQIPDDFKKNMAPIIGKYVR
ncbi:MAG: S-methyl-5'-thioadenosine phosphorylase [SAR202 cluster bacterium]|nr:S-methyl-5'-thioadenosine phosphorylase [SAR202 cluster bacterium]